MPDQKTQNPTGNNPPPQNPLANDIQSAYKAAWLRLRDRGKTPSEVSSMMADLSAEDFNALSSAISEAKRYGRKEVIYKGFNIPVPDKSAFLLRKNFEERQADIQSRIEQASKGLGEQFFGTGIGGIGTELGKLIGIKPKKAAIKDKGQKTKDQGSKAKDEEQKTEKAEEQPKPEEEKKTVEEEEFETSGESERGPTGTLRIQTPQTATGPTGTLKMAAAAAPIPTSTEGGTVRIPQNTKGGTLRMPSPTAGPTGTARIPSEIAKGATLRIPKGTSGRTLKIEQDIPSRTLRIETPESRNPKTDIRQDLRTSETAPEKSKSKYELNPDAWFEDAEKAKTDLEKAKVQMREILGKPKISVEDAVKFANVENDFSKNTQEITQYTGVSFADDEYNDLYAKFRSKIGEDRDVESAYSKEDSRLSDVHFLEPENQPTKRGTPAVINATIGVAGAASGSALEGKTRSAPPASPSSNVAPSSVQVSRERKVTVSSQPQTAADESTASTGIESIEVDKERKVTTSTEITPPTAAPQPPQAEVGSVEVQHQGKITTQTTQPTVASPAGRQESRMAFRMPGAPPPSAPPTVGQPKGPSAPRPMSSADLLSQADQLVEQTKKFTSRMTVNSSDVMLKAQMRGLKEQAAALRANIANTQKAGSIFAPERAALSRLDDRLGMIEGSLMGDVGMGASVELATGLGLYDRERPEIGNTLSPTLPIAAPRRVATPRPTGIGAPPVAGGVVATTGRAFPGPRPPRPITGMAPQRSAASQMGAAMQLGAAQQQAALQSMGAEDYGEEQLIGDSSAPPDVRSEALSQVGGVQQGGGILPGQYAPRGYEDVYGGGISPQHVSRSERAPGAAYEEEEELSEEELAQEGGELGSDEAERARVLAEQQAAARRAADFSGAPGMAGPKAKPKTAPMPKPATKPGPGAGTGGGAAAGGAGKSLAAGAVSPGQMAALLAAQKAKSVMVNTLAKNEALRQQIEGLRNVQKNLQNIWRVVNASELLSAEAVFPIILWIFTSNLQMINKYSFKVQFIPPATLVEDGLTFCVDCLLGSSCLMNVVIYITIAALIVLPYFIVGGTIVGIFSAIGVDPIQAMWDAINYFAS